MTSGTRRVPVGEAASFVAAPGRWGAICGPISALYCTTFGN
jgi:hypothetical protein